MRLIELERQRLKEQKRIDEEKNKLEEDKRKLEEARQAELERKQQEEEAKRLALEEQKHKEEEAAKARVTIIFYRNQGYIGGGGTVSISHNNENIGRLQNKTFFIYFSPPGTQKFLTSVQGIDLEKTFEFKPSLTYYISYNFTFDATLEIIPNSDGRVAIKGIKNTGNINPADVLSDYDETEAYKEDTSTKRVPL